MKSFSSRVYLQLSLGASLFIWLKQEIWSFVKWNSASGPAAESTLEIYDLFDLSTREHWSCQYLELIDHPFSIPSPRAIWCAILNKSRIFQKIQNERFRSFEFHDIVNKTSINVKDI